MVEAAIYHSLWYITSMGQDQRLQVLLDWKVSQWKCGLMQAEIHQGRCSWKTLIPVQWGVGIWMPSWRVRFPASFECGQISKVLPVKHDPEWWMSGLFKGWNVDAPVTHSQFIRRGQCLKEWQSNKMKRSRIPKWQRVKQLCLANLDSSWKSVTWMRVFHKPLHLGVFLVIAS